MINRDFDITAADPGAARAIGEYLASQPLESPELDAAGLAEQLRFAHNENDELSSRLGVVETELQAANEIIAELRDNVVHMEGSDGNCLACCQPWMCDGYYADVSIGGVS